jgi:hypothetical protein
VSHQRGIHAPKIAYPTLHERARAAPLQVQHPLHSVASGSKKFTARGPSRSDLTNLRKSGSLCISQPPLPWTRNRGRPSSRSAVGRKQASAGKEVGQIAPHSLHTAPGRSAGSRAHPQLLALAAGAGDALTHEVLRKVVRDALKYLGSPARQGTGPPASQLQGCGGEIEIGASTRQTRKEAVQGVRGGECPPQRRGRRSSECKWAGLADDRISARGADARNAGGQASASTSARGASARSGRGEQMPASEPEEQMHGVCRSEDPLPAEALVTLQPPCQRTPGAARTPRKEHPPPTAPAGSDAARRRQQVETDLSAVGSCDSVTVRSGRGELSSADSSTLATRCCPVGVNETYPALCRVQDPSCRTQYPFCRTQLSLSLPSRYSLPFCPPPPPTLSLFFRLVTPPPPGVTGRRGRDI